MTDDRWVWLIRVMWLALPFAASPLFGEALEESTRALQITGTVGAWTFWALGLLLVSVPHVNTLMPFRIVAPGALSCVLWATIVAGASASSIGALALAGAVSVIALSPPVGAWFINGSSYGDERRIPLRPPGQMLLGPIPLAWALIAATALAIPLLFASERWLAGAVSTAAAVPAALVAGRALHRLSHRWLVFVPAGVVVHDRLTVSDPALFKRSAITSLGPALADTTAVDLTAGALGLALDLRLRSAVELSFCARPGAEAQNQEVTAITISPSRPGAVLEEAKRRRIPVG